MIDRTYNCPVCYDRGWVATGDNDPTDCPRCEEAAEKEEHHG